MKTKAAINVKNKMYPYTLERTGSNRVRVVAKDAHLDQEFLAEDVSEIILDLPNLILAELQYQKKQSDVIQFRVSGRDKAKIEAQALKLGYSSVSEYIRDISLKTTNA